MVVTRDIPQANDIIAQSQPQLLANNQGYVDVFAINHVAYNAVGQGKHKFCTFPVQAAAPATTSGEGAAYTKDSTILAGRSDLYYKYQTSGGTSMTGLEFPLNICKAFGKADTTGLIAGTSFNITSAAFAGSTWTIIFASPFVTGANANKMMVLTTAQGIAANSVATNYNIVDETTITIQRLNGAISAVCFWVMAI